MILKWVLALLITDSFARQRAHEQRFAKKPAYLRRNLLKVVRIAALASLLRNFWIKHSYQGHLTMLGSVGFVFFLALSNNRLASDIPA
jgi:hypothetical protein